MTDEHMKVVEAMRDEFVRSDKHWGTPQFDTSACLGYAAALDHLLSVVKANQWVRVETEADLPPNGWYLVMNQESMQVAQMHNGTWYDQAEDDFIDTYVDAWMPLPNPIRRKPTMTDTKDELEQRARELVANWKAEIDKNPSAYKPVDFEQDIAQRFTQFALQTNADLIQERDRLREALERITRPCPYGDCSCRALHAIATEALNKGEAKENKDAE